MEPLISIIIPACNAEKFIQRCIDSIIVQTHRSIEVIAVDDGSADGTGSIIDELAKMDSRIVPVHQQNAGAAKARLAGIQCAKGDYLTFVDADDFIEPQMLQTLLSMIQSGDYQIACCKYNRVTETGKPSEAVADDVTSVYDFEGIIKNLYREKLWSVWGKLYSRVLFDDNELITEDLKVSEDLLLVYSLYRKCRSIITCDKKLYNYFRHSGSVMNEALNPTTIRDSMRAYRIIAEDMDKDTNAYVYHMQNLLSNDLGYLNRIVLEGTCRECYEDIREEILENKQYAFLQKDNPVLNNRHRLGIQLLRLSPKLFDLSVRIKG